jgi:hypothetical protein
MKLFGIEFGSSVVRTEPQAMSTPFLKVGKGNLALPFIQTLTHKQGVIYFGAENLYPSLINQMYYTSGLHSSIVNFQVKATIGGGFSIEGLENDGKAKVDAEVWKRKNKVNKMLRQLARDKKLHDRVHVLLTFSDSMKFLKMERVEPASIRYRMDGNYEYSTDWSTSRDRRTIEAYHPAKKCKEMLYTYGEVGAGQDVYPIPSYSAAMNWIFLDGEQSFFHKSNIQNSIFPSMVIRRPKRFSNKQEIENFTDGLTANQGAENSGKVWVLTGDGFENTPEVTPVNANNNDKLFDTTAKELKDNICFAHGINPSIMGIKVAGSLGNAQELEMSYSIWEKNMVYPEREELEEIFNSLMQIAGVVGTFQINGFKIIGDEIVDSEEGQINKTGELLNAMSPLLANKVLENLTVNEIRAIAGLSKVDGGDEIALPTLTPVGE